MYIHPFVAGIIFTTLFELVLLIGWAVLSGKSNNNRR